MKRRSTSKAGATTSAVELRQLGSANRAQVTQWAGFSSLTFTQEGSGNELNARQATRDGIIRGNTVGNDNRVNIDQIYDSPVLDIAQNGSANEIDVVQHTPTAPCQSPRLAMATSRC